jgi:signal transduction histidine kinase
MFHSKMIVEAHHGRIQVQSVAGSGTTFEVTLPLQPK